MSIYFTGFMGSPLWPQQLTEIIYKGLTNIDIGYKYILLWQSEKLWLKYDPNTPFYKDINNLVPITIPMYNEYCKFVLPHHQKDVISIISTNGNIWEYDILYRFWKQIAVINYKNDEHAVTIVKFGYIVLLTSFGRLLTIPDKKEIKHSAKFINIVSGVDHAILLAKNNNVYSMGIGKYGQLGNDNVDPIPILTPLLILELVGLKIVQISAGAWHSAAVTDKGDLYTWGWNTYGELGFSNIDINIQSIPKLVKFKDDKDNIIKVNVRRVRCGNCFTICITDNGIFWGAGVNNCGQLGTPEYVLRDSNKFIKLNVAPITGKIVRNFKCNEWGTAIIT